MYDTLIVGGGPAGLSAALILGRCLRSVVVIDHGRPRNAYSHSLHGYLSQHDIPPKEFIRKSHDQLAHFENIQIKNAEALTVKKKENYFETYLSTGETIRSKKLLLATGVIDEVPNITGIHELYGQSVFQCPYCDGWEVRNQPLAVLGKGERGYKMALMMTTWSRDLILCTDGPAKLTVEQIAHLKRNEICIREEKIKSLEGYQGQLKFIHFENGNSLARKSLFFNTPSFIRSNLLDQLECEFTESEGVITGKYEATSIPGLFVAGNITRDVQLVIVAAAEGAQAAFGINYELAHESIKS